MRALGGAPRCHVAAEWAQAGLPAALELCGSTCKAGRESSAAKPGSSVLLPGRLPQQVPPWSSAGCSPHPFPHLCQSCIHLLLQL